METLDRASKMKIISDYMRELAYRSVEVQKSNPNKMKDLAKLGLLARQAKKHKRLQEIDEAVDVVFK